MANSSSSSGASLSAVCRKTVRSVLFCQRRVIFVSLVLMLLITVVYYGTSFRWSPNSAGVTPKRGPSSSISSRLFPPPISSSTVTRRTKQNIPNDAPLPPSPMSPSSSPLSVCLPEDEVVAAHEPDIETVDVHPKLNFDAEWMDRREYWNDKMERRYEKRRQNTWSKVPLEVIVMPHSHNDPGWLKTVDGYFHGQTKNILNNAVDKMTKYKNMTFVWTEMSFLSMWFETAHEARKANFRALVNEGRFEILTGGWVMTDEANVDLFGMVDQLVEGHEWIRNTLNITSPRSSWSVDPFGHGGTFPYILKSSGVEAMVIMRIHYAWKEYFARGQSGDFMWTQRWSRDPKRTSILCHNFPYDIYSIKGSCGPHAQTCLEFNFRRVSGDFNEYTARTVPVTAANLKERSETLLEQYGKTGSLFPHNVVLVPLGDDFTYDHENEWDQQYSNYKMIMDYINQGAYNATVRFGTLTDYFDAVRRRMSPGSFDTLAGDFHVYADIFSEGRPAYWSGYYTTRPFMKRLARELEGHLRASEILFTYSYALSRQSGDSAAINHFASSLYSDLVSARRSLALFQHHDAITGTSKQFVMHDYGTRLFDGVTKCRKIQSSAMQFLLTHRKDDPTWKPPPLSTPLLAEDLDRPSYAQLPAPRALNIHAKNKGGQSSVVVFNPLAERVSEVVSVFVETSDVCVTDAGTGKEIVYQINPTWNVSGFFRLDVTFVEISFVAVLDPLSVSRFEISRCKIDHSKREQTQVYCLRCPSNSHPTNPIAMEAMPPGAVQIENSNLVLLFDEDSRMLKQVTDKTTGRSLPLEVFFAAYPTAQFRSGAYLFKPDGHQDENVAVFGDSDLREVVVISGPVFSEVSAVFESGVSPTEPGTFVHTVRLFHTADGIKERAVYIENNFSFGDSINHHDVDLFMRLRTGVRNGASAPVFYGDMNGLQMQKRVKVAHIGIEGNYYPITSKAFIEDEEWRVGLAVDHAMGASAWSEGWLEVMVDRRSTFDDARGMGEGVLDNRETAHRYWLTVERQQGPSNAAEKKEVPVPSQVMNTLSRYLDHPTVQFVTAAAADATAATVAVLKSTEKLSPGAKLLEAPLDCDMHLFNLRTQSDPEHPTLPGKTALMTLHRQGRKCGLADHCAGSEAAKSHNVAPRFAGVSVRGARKCGLTGGQVQKNGSVNLEEVSVDPMALEAFEITL